MKHRLWSGLRPVSGRYRLVAEASQWDGRDRESEGRGERLAMGTLGKGEEPGAMVGDPRGDGSGANLCNAITQSR